jgi:hypothetical protein
VAAPRTREQRRADALAILGAGEADVWVATASADGDASLVPLSLGWTGERVVLVTESRSPTARNVIASGRARMAAGASRDVVMIDAELETATPLADGPADALERFATQSGWDPRPMADADAYLVLVLRPIRIQAWREANELAGRTLMRDGAWLD